MIQHVKIGGKEYPFKFGMREVFQLTSQQGVEFDEADKRIAMDFDAFLSLFHLASKKGARLEGSDLVLSSIEIEDAIDDDPGVFMALQEALENSKVVQDMQQASEKKTKPSSG